MPVVFRVGDRLFDDIVNIARVREGLLLIRNDGAVLVGNNNVKALTAKQASRLLARNLISRLPSA